jgi:carboxylesterase type B
MFYFVLLLLTCGLTEVLSSSLYDVNDDYDSYASGPIVTTKYGQIEGSRRLYDRQVYEEYLGIPYADPPVGDFRWQRTRPLTPWEGVWNATSYSIHCTQLISPLYVFVGMGGITGEDCLYLNIWVPNTVAANEGTKLPVMVFIYGGGFSFGTGEMYPGYGLALHGNMIVVNFNYRLNAIGWLSTGDDALPGNYGFWDVQAALQWVQENIADFAGDPSRVTVFGQSAGGALASYASISPLTRGLLHRAISISGASCGSFATEQHPLYAAALLADIFNCTNVQTSTDLVNCLRPIDDYALAFWGTMGQMLYGQRVPSFKPVVDGILIPMLPRDCWEQGYGQYVDLMTGSTYDDAAGFVIANPIGLPYLGDKGNMAATNESMWESLRLVLGGTSNKDDLISDIILHYPDMDTTDNLTRTLAMTRSQTEWNFGSGSHWEANQHAGYGSGKGTYHYQFRYRPTFLTGYPAWVNGSHLDDIYSVLGYPFMEIYRKRFLSFDFNETDYIVSSNIMDYYTNFAYTGNPNVGPKPVTVQWTEFDPAQQNYLQEGVTCSVENVDPSVIENYRYWMDEFPLKAEFPPDPTFPLPEYRRVTEEDLEDAVERFRELLKEMLAENDEALDMMMTITDEMVEKRAMQLGLK